jgi:hypothetical protein
VATVARPSVARDVTPSRGRTLRRVGLLAVAAGTIALFAVSRGKWSDAIIDSGREWIVPDALARGKLLYRDVVYWFGPFTPYFQSLFFRLIGSGFEALVASGIVCAIAALTALRAALARVTGRRDADLWTVLAIPALVFMPQAGGAILGMGYRIWHAAIFTLLAIAVASRPPRGTGWLRFAGAGALAGLAGLCRTEWGLVALASVIAALAHGRRPRQRTAFACGAAVAGALGAFCLPMLFFLLRAGPAAVIGDGHVFLTGLPPETRAFLRRFSGIEDWKRGSILLLYSSAMWLAAFLACDLIARRRAAAWRRTAAWLAASLLLLGALAAVGGASGPVVWSAAPLLCLASLLVAATRRGSAAFAAGLAGLLLSYRRPFHISDSGYVAPPLLFAFVCAAFLVRKGAAASRRQTGSARPSLVFGRAVAVAIVCVFAVRGAEYAADRSVPVHGTAGMISAREDVVRQIDALAEAVRRSTGPSDGLVVFPEGEVLNCVSGRSNPIRHMLYLPGYLTADNEEGILRELESARPAAVVVWRVPKSEYGPAFFGEDYGTRIGAWIARDYERVVLPGWRRGDRAYLALRRDRRGVSRPADEAR